MGIPRYLPSNIQVLLTKRGFRSVTELARAAKMSQATLHRITSGEVTDPRYTLLRSLASALKVTVTDLVERNYAEDATRPPARAKYVAVIGGTQPSEEEFWDSNVSGPGRGGFIEWPTTDADAYALQCNDRSQMPRIKPGEFIVITPSRDYAPGDEVSVFTKAHIILGTFMYDRDGVAHLISLNEDGPPIRVEKNDIKHIHFIAGYAKAGLFTR